MRVVVLLGLLALLGALVGCRPDAPDCRKFVNKRMSLFDEGAQIDEQHLFQQCQSGAYTITQVNCIMDATTNAEARTCLGLK